jgi:hypothetical protein
MNFRTPIDFLFWGAIGEFPAPRSSTRYGLTVSMLSYYLTDTLTGTAVPVNNIFSVLGFAGVLHAQRELVTAFFVYNVSSSPDLFLVSLSDTCSPGYYLIQISFNIFICVCLHQAVQMVVTLHFFVDLCTDVGIR